jgi:hypothetical protein
MKTKIFFSEEVMRSLLPFIKPNVLLLILVCCLLMRCSDQHDDVKPDPVPTQDVSIQELKDFIASAYGLPASAIVYRDAANGQYFVIDGDMLMAKKTAEFYYREEKANPQGRSKQRRTTFLVTQATVTDVRVRITPGVPADWAAATRTAMASWNSVTGTGLAFREVTTGEHIQVFVGDITTNPNAIAQAETPLSNGQPGTFVQIDIDHLGEPSKIFTMAHELGHTIGLHHTNTTAGTHISGTPTSDPQSVMNATVLPWNGFTLGDKSAVQILYPFGTVTGNLYVIQGSALVKASQTTGDWQVLGAGNEWQGTYEMTSVGGNLYMVQGGALVRANPTNGAWSIVGTGEWSGTTALTSYNSNLYMVQGGVLVTANPNDGAWAVLGDGEWSGSTTMTACNDNLYIIQGSALVRADPGNGAWTVVGDGSEWSGTNLMTSIGSYLYMIQGAALIRTDPNTGAWTILGNGNEWAGTSTLTSYNGSLYMVQGGALVTANPSNGAWTVIGDGTEWSGSTTMASN